MNRELDDAAINSILLPAEHNYHTHYFRTLQLCKKEIKQQFRDALAIPHENIFLLANSTHCLLTVLYGLSVQGRTLSIAAGSYRPYRTIPLSVKEPYLPLLTHISPDSGEVVCIHEPAVILDAAQSAGAICHHAKAFATDIVFFPLHKHLALQTGIGVLCVSDNPEYKEILKVAKISESGTVNDQVFRSLHNRLSAQTVMYNIAMFSLTEALAEELSYFGLTSITPLYSRTPFLVFKIESRHLQPERLEKTIFSLKILDELHWRISCYIPGGPDASPVECSTALVNIFRRKL